MADQTRPRWQPTRRQVAAFLRAANVEAGEVTSEIYDRYAPLVAAAGKPGLPRHRLAVLLVSDAIAVGAEPPTVTTLRERWAKRQAERKAVMEEVNAFVEKDAEAARTYVAEVRLRTGAGPTWSELSAAMEWPVPLRELIVRHLRRQGVLTFDITARSLDITP